MSFSKTWSEAQPASSNDASQGATEIRDAKFAWRERFAVDHRAFADESGQENVGAHNSVTFIPQAADLAALADAIKIYAKTVDGSQHLFSIDKDGTIVQLTVAGRIALANLYTVGMTVGDMFYFNGDTVVRLPKGNQDQFIRMGPANVPIWSDFQGVPTGAMFPWGGTGAPAGYLSCDASAVSRTTYANLFAAIGTTHGAGDGSTTFNLPDCRDRFVFGANGGVANPGDKGPTTNVSPTLSGSGNDMYQTGLAAAPGQSGALQSGPNPTVDSNHTHSVKFMPRYISLPWVIKT